jgi:hypothetical protein
VTAASAGSSFIVTVLVWRLYLGWQVGGEIMIYTIKYNKQQQLNKNNNM